MSREAPPFKLHRRSMRRRLLTGGRPRPPRLELRLARAATRERPLSRLVRQVTGWVVVATGIVLIVMPVVPGFFLLPVGVALVGRRQWLVRWTRTSVKLGLRVAETWPGWLGRIGRRARAAEKRIAKVLRDRRLGARSRPIC